MAITRSAVLASSVRPEAAPFSSELSRLPLGLCGWQRNRFMGSPASGKINTTTVCAFKTKSRSRPFSFFFAVADPAARASQGHRVVATTAIVSFSVFSASGLHRNLPQRPALYSASGSQSRQYRFGSIQRIYRSGTLRQLPRTACKGMSLSRHGYLWLLCWWLC